jgi:hypothetical protein
VSKKVRRTFAGIFMKFEECYHLLSSSKHVERDLKCLNNFARGIQVLSESISEKARRKRSSFSRSLEESNVPVINVYKSVHESNLAESLTKKKQERNN